jgi:hypothetical protein
VRSRGDEIEKRSAKTLFVAVLCILWASSALQAAVFINEIYLNPTESDEQNEYIELMGTPGMNLTGYAVAILNGTQVKYYPEDSIPSGPAEGPEIDEFFSLDGLSLGANGTLSLVSSDPSHPLRYPFLLPTSNWIIWVPDVPPLYDNPGLWNGRGGSDPPGKLSNSGSVTVILIRNRPGMTEADPCNPAGLLWGKSVMHDVFLDEHVWTGTEWMDQWGNGNIDKGEPNGMGGYSLDLTGLSNSDPNDDLEIVDELSYEDEAGWEYDTDGRHVDNGNSEPNFPPRHVHALDNPIGFKPDAISRVDYRTTGVGWVPSGDGTGEMTNGNNWQDTATEQWIRGNSTHSDSLPRKFYYDNGSVPLNTVQPYETNVPLWLDDGSGTDYNFGAIETYALMVGRTNPLAVPFIQGDVNRDGVCDTDDIAKTAAVFGDDDWIFSNSFSDAPEGDEVDPNTQTKPWDVDGTGDNGIEASDLQWTLNFQGDTTGHIVGVAYDTTTPASSGVYLNSNAGTECTVTTSVNIPSGRTLSTLIIGDIVEITVEGEVTADANTTSGQENGIMQFVHDVNIAPDGVIKVVSVEPLGPFSTTRASLQEKQGTDGDSGMDTINGYTTSFTEGLSAAADLYRITLEAVCTGSANVTIQPAEDAKFAASTPGGLKIGHTDSNGNPASVVAASPVSVISLAPPGDFDGDDDEDLADLFIFMAAFPSDDTPTGNWDPDCDISDPCDGVVDLADYGVFVEFWQRGCGN